MKIIRNTPVEKHGAIYVKREDLCAAPPSPPFSKVRGLFHVLVRLKAEGYTHIGYTETSVSMAGWGVAYCCQELGLTAVIFDPQYKVTPPLLKYHRKNWEKFGATIVPQKAGMAKVNWNISKNYLRDKYGERAYLLPLGVPFPETIEATRQEAVVTRESSEVDYQTIVVNVGSGTICAGVLQGFSDRTVIGVMGRTGDVKRKRKLILGKADIIEDGLFGTPTDFHLVDEGWEYTERSYAKPPFPCHPWYDLKAWQWLIENFQELERPVLFWNIGRVI